MKSALCICVFLYGLVLDGFGQVDDVLNIREVNISDNRLQSIKQTSRVKSTDTLTINRLNLATLNDLLNQSSTVFLKDNGGGRLATISIRGTTASQNALSWNGLLLNTPTLGLSDLSLMPAFFIDHVAIQYGGNGSLNGSASIGGAVHMTAAPVFNAGWNGKLFFSNASFSDYQQGVSVSYSGKKYFMRTAYYHHTAANNYSFKDSYILKFPEREQVHASLKQYGLLQDHYLMLNKNLLSIQLMYLDADREIPPLMGSVLYQSEKAEKDKQLRLVTQWKHYEGKLQTMVRLGFLDDRIDYTDNQIKLDDRSRGQNLQAEAEVVYISGIHQFQAGGISNFSRAYVNSITGKEVQGYPDNHALHRSSVYCSYILKLKRALLTTLSIRKELEKEKDYPLLPSMGLKLRLYKEFYIYTNAAAVYRTPTLNDLYWTPGGNPFLKPEKGYQSDLRLQIHSTLKNVSIDVEAGVYYMKINNWIQWVPDNHNNYSPVNIETVVSQGVELSGHLSYHWRKWKMVTGGEMEYIRATNNNGFGIASVAGKQLIYTPKVKWLLTAAVSYKNTTLGLQYHYTGYRYTTADNSNWLIPYGVANCSLAQEFNSRLGNIYITAGVNNLFDENYEVVALRPLPGRWYRLSVLLNILKEKKSTEPVSQ